MLLNPAKNCLRLGFQKIKQRLKQGYWNLRSLRLIHKALWFIKLHVISAHAKDVTETLEEFDDEFNIIEAPNLSDEDIAAEKATLKEAEDEINQVNNDADSPFKEALNEFSDLPGEEFLKEKTGVIREGMVTYVPICSRLFLLL